MRRDLPTGTVTFLFTDIEGSTRLLQELGGGYADVLAEHRRIIRDTTASHGGVEVDTQGDAFFIAFSRAADAVAAALDAQDRLGSGPIRVRMGLHTGEPTVTEEGYVGLDVHKAARIAAAGSGGQVLLSESTRRLVDTQARDLGLHRLKDLQRPERLYQLGSDGFRPLTTLNQTNLPVQPTPFLGRARELSDVLERLRRDDVRLLTLTGAGGSGKTRLALQAAAEVVEEYPDGVWFVGLAALADASLVVPTITHTLGLGGSGDTSDAEMLAEHLRRRRALLVLDNLEHLLPDAAPLIAYLSSSAPNVDLITSSREPLHLSAEHEYPVPPLSLTEAVDLFLERARSVRPGFAITGSRSSVEAICTRLDRLPLAIELAAARTRVLSQAQLLERLDRRLPMLTGGARDAPERHRTLRATIAWSHDLLTEDEQLLFGRLAVFAGGWTLEAAEQVCDADLDALQSMIDKSLVRAESDASDRARYTMLETIHEFALERLAEHPDAEDRRRRHAEYFVELARTADPKLKGPDQARWIALLDPEHDNFRTAIAWSLTPSGITSSGAELVTLLMTLWEARGHWQEARGWLDDVIRAGRELGAAARAPVLFAAGRLAGFRGDIETARALLEESVELARQAGDRRTLALALASFTWTHAMNGQDIHQSVAFGEEAVRVARVLDDHWVLAETLNDLGGALSEAAHSEMAADLLGESLAIRRQLGDVRKIADSLNNLGWNSLLLDDYQQSARYLEESLALARRVDDKPHILLAEDNLALVHLFTGEPELAEALFLNGVRTCRELGDLRIGEEALLGLAGVAALRGTWERSAWLAGAAAGVAAVTGATSNPAFESIHERFVARARMALGDEAFERELERGRVASFDEAVDRALAPTPGA